MDAKIAEGTVIRFKLDGREVASRNAEPRYAAARGIVLSSHREPGRFSASTRALEARRSISKNPL